MKHTKTILLLLFSLSLRSQTDFRYDNVIYKTMYPKELCAFLRDNPKTVLIDVRSPGEFSDTSMYKSLNIGHLKNAINIPIDSIPKMIPELKKHAGDPVILYCSHSQRSRRVSKTLQENGFSQVRNLNAGMSWMNQADEKDFPCKKEMIISVLPYKSIPASETYELIRKSKDLVIFDLRSVSEFEGTDTLEKMNIGRIKNAINIPAAEIKNKLSMLEPYKNKMILLYDINGAESNRAAELLAQRGFTQVYTILGGISALIGKDLETSAMRKEILDNTPAYTILNVKESLDLIMAKPELLILDVRPDDEYNNQSKQTWRNLGRIKKAVHMTPEEFSRKISDLDKYKKSVILVYGNRYAARSCKQLKEAGFEHVSLMYESLWDMVYTLTNIDGFKNIRMVLENNEGLY